MKRICLGTMITLLYQSRMRSADKIKTACGGIFAAFGLDIDNFNKGLPSHLKSGHDPAPGDLIDAARNLSIEDIDRGFEEYVLPLIHNEKHEAVFRAIISTENDKLGANIREIGTGYIDGFVGSGENIYFISPLVDQDQVSPLKHKDDGTILIDDTHMYSDKGYVPDWERKENYIGLLPYGDRV